MGVSRRASDQTIHAHDIHILMQTLNRQQWRQTLRELERLEPALAAYIKTAGTTVVRNLTAYDCSTDAIRSTEQFVLHALVLVAEAVAQGHRRLFDDLLPDDGTSGSATEMQP